MSEEIKAKVCKRAIKTATFACHACIKPENCRLIVQLVPSYGSTGVSEPDNCPYGCIAVTPKWKLLKGRPRKK